MVYRSPIIRSESEQGSQINVIIYDKEVPDGTMKNIKVRFCVRGNIQISGVDYFDTLVPIFQWLSITIHLNKKQTYYTNKLAQYPLKGDEEVQIELPHGFDFKRQVEYVAQLNYVLYGMIQFPKRQFAMLSMGLHACGMAPSDYDVCLFMVEHGICMIYVNYCLLFSK